MRRAKIMLARTSLKLWEVKAGLDVRSVDMITSRKKKNFRLYLLAAIMATRHWISEKNIHSTYNL